MIHFYFLNSEKCLGAEKLGVFVLEASCVDTDGGQSSLINTVENAVCPVDWTIHIHTYINQTLDFPPMLSVCL